MSMRGRRMLAAAFATVAAATPVASAAGAAKRSVAVGSGGAVASENLQATRAGLSVLRQGGTAADAAVAVASTLGVSDPYVAGIGGGGYFVLYDARSHRVDTIDGRETAPSAATPTLFIDRSTGKPLPFATAVTSGLSVGVPGNLMTWQRALDRWGRFGLAADLAPAERVASGGFTVDANFREQTSENQARFTRFRSTSALFLPHGQLPAIGSTLRNPDLARTYRLIARKGIGLLYGGALGGDVTRAVRHLPVAPGVTPAPLPGLMTVADLARYRTRDRAPTHVRYRGYDVYGMAPSSSGGSTVGEALNILSNFHLGHQTRVQQLHHFLEATRLAFADRNRYVGDPHFIHVPLRQLLSPVFGKQRACLINPARALSSPVAPGDPFSGTAGCHPAQPTTAAPAQEGTNTNHFVIADRSGNVVSYTNTIEQLGGSGVVVPHRGFLLNNELTDFNFAPASTTRPDPNLPAAGKRPRSSMSPTIVLRRGHPVLAVGAAGGATIITTVLQILVGRLDWHLSLPAALAAPRASQRNSASTQAEPAFIAQPTTAALRQLGQVFSVSATSPLDPMIRTAPTIGVASALELLGHGRVLAAAEPARRGGGSAATVKPAR